MKRPLEVDESTDDEPSTSKQKLDNNEIPKETIILKNLQKNLLKGDSDRQNVKMDLLETQKKYFAVYLEKLMNNLPMGKDLINIIIQKFGSSDFEYMFTAAKSIIQSQMRLKQIKAFHGVFDMVYGLVWRYVHEKIVSPTLEKVLSPKHLQLAYEKYQCCSKTEDEGSVIELQCLLYCIQESLENEETVKIPNPLYSRFTQQIKAMSEYVVALLVSMSKPTINPLIGNDLINGPTFDEPTVSETIHEPTVSDTIDEPSVSEINEISEILSNAVNK